MHWRTLTSTTASVLELIRAEDSSDLPHAMREALRAATTPVRRPGSVAGAINAEVLPTKSTRAPARRIIPGTNSCSRPGTALLQLSESELLVKVSKKKNICAKVRLR